jgi:hypothetical protein
MVQMQASLFRKLYIFTSRHARDGQTELSWDPEPNSRPAHPHTHAPMRNSDQRCHSDCMRMLLVNVPKKARSGRQSWQGETLRQSLKCGSMRRPWQAVGCCTCSRAGGRGCKGAGTAGATWPVGAVAGDAVSGGATRGKAGQAQDGLLVGHQLLQHLVRQAAQRLRRSRRAPRLAPVSKDFMLFACTHCRPGLPCSLAIPTMLHACSVPIGRTTLICFKQRQAVLVHRFT